MSKPRIAMLMGKSTRNRVFAEQHIQQLQEIGELVMEDHEQLDAEIGKKIIQDADIVITSWGAPRLTEELLEQAPNLKLAAHAAGSVKTIVSPELWECGVRVSSANMALAIGVAETALGMTIASLKNMWRLVDSARNGEWHEERNRVRELYNVTIGVIGAGKAGAHYIKLLQNFNVDVILYDPILTEEQAQAMGAKKVELEELCKQADVISIHAPSIPATYHMINEERLAMMKDDAIIINTARGSIIDEDALVNELRKGRLFACLDVTDPEPPAKDHPFRELPNCVLTCHIAGAVTNGLQRIAAYVIEEIKRFQEGRPLDGEVKESALNIIA